MQVFKRNAAGNPRKRWWRGATAISLVVVSAVAFAACGSDSDDSGDDDGGNSASIPAFSSKALYETAGKNWITNGGSTNNQRYSSLDEINDANVAKVKGDWKVDLQSGTDAKYSAEAQVIAYNGVLYVPTGEDDVYAFDAATGKQKWKYEGNLSEDITTVCCGWLSRGVGIGDGRVYIGKLDGHMVALDAETGKVDWDKEVISWKKENGGITAAPLYYDGLVYAGTTGGEYGVRGRLTALDAKTGEEAWRFYTTPDASDKVGGPTWAGDSALTGGVPIWQTPSVDPERGMLYFTTGNANPDVDGSEREGDNLYAASFVALDAKSGEYKWHWQATKHDIWDYDMPSPTVLFDAEIDGKTVPAIAEAAKTGWVYALNRETGEPIWPGGEQPVAQSAQQKTAATQWIPDYAPVADHDISDQEFAEVSKLIKSNPEGKNLKIVRGVGEGNSVYTPATPDTAAVIANGATGGSNWQPSSYNPNTNLIYACGTNGVEGVWPSGVAERMEGEVRIGSILAALPFSTPGYLAAVDANTGDTKWKKEWKSGSCYSGSVTTAGNLLFVGQNDGNLVALNAETGDELWKFQTGAGANSTVTPFEIDGKQKIAFLAGGNSLAATPHGDNLWVFSLDGKLESLPGVETAAAGEAHAGETTDDAAADADDPAPEAGDDDQTGKEGQDDTATSSETGDDAVEDTEGN